MTASTKSSQLQIRVSPEQKAALKRMAAQAGVSVSAFVMSRVLPSSQRDFEEKARTLATDPSRQNALSALAAYLETLSPEELSLAVAAPTLGDLPPVLQNYVAAAVERAAYDAGVDTPAWVTALAPHHRPSFAWELRSLRPHLMKLTPLTFKRRNIYVAVPPGAGSRRRTTPDGTAGGLLAQLDAELEGTDVEVELCRVGGAHMPIVFAADPPTRRPRAIFASLTTLLRATRAVAERAGLAEDWTGDAVRSLVEGSGPQRFYDGVRLRVFVPPPTYVLAMRCARLAFERDAEAREAAEQDVQYLLRYLDIRSSEEGLELIGRYLNERQRPADLADRLESMLPRF